MKTYQTNNPNLRTRTANTNLAALKWRSSGNAALTVWSLCFLVAFGLTCAVAQTTNVYHSGFETELDLDDWGFDGPWEIGVPTSGPNAAYNGTRVAGTVLAGNYADDTSGRLVSPPIAVPSVDDNPRLRWAQWYQFNSHDSGRLQIRVGHGEWTDLPGHPVLTGSGSGVWSEARVDLSPYAGQSLRIGFLLSSSSAGLLPRVGPGW